MAFVGTVKKRWQPFVLTSWAEVGDQRASEDSVGGQEGHGDSLEQTGGIVQVG